MTDHPRLVTESEQAPATAGEPPVAGDWPSPPPPEQFGEPPAGGTGPARRRPAGLMLAAVILAVGLGVGIAVGEVIGRHGTSTTSNGSGPTISIDTSRLPSTAQGIAVTVASQLSPAVATIISGQGTGSALGSGFVISNSGDTSYLLTNNHVVAGASDLRVVMPDGRTYTATLVGADSFADLAVVSVPSGRLPVAVFAKSADLKVGENVVAIGSPLGNQGSVTAGVISALHRTIQAGGEQGTTPETLQDVLQTDTPISPGNSGGPLADAAGRVVGVNVAVSGQGSNIGFSIPSDIAQSIAGSLMAHQTVRHPFIGIAYMDPIDAARSGQPFEGPGVVVTQVQSGSPADSAGIKQGDIIVSIDGVALDNGQTIGGLIQPHHVGDKLRMSIKRGSQTLTLDVTLTDRPSSP